MTAVQPLGKTIFGKTIWPAPRKPGHVDHLVWNGPGARVHLHVRGRKVDTQEYVGTDAGHISEPCEDLAAAQAAVDGFHARPRRGGTL